MSERKERFFCFGCKNLVILVLASLLLFIGEFKASSDLLLMHKQPSLVWKANFPCKSPKCPQKSSYFMTFCLFCSFFQQLNLLPSVNTLGSQISEESALLSEFSSFKLNSIVGGFKARFLGHKVNCLGIEFQFHQIKLKTIYILKGVHL